MVTPTRRRHRQQREPEGQGERFVLTLTEMAHQGHALGHRDGEVVFAAFGIPGETVEVEVRQRHRSYLEAEVVRVVEASPHRVEAPCSYYGQCGGCQLQHVSYDHQLTLKRSVVVDQLRRIGKFPDPPVTPARAAPSPWRYRNHARFTINREGLLGFTRRGTHRVIPIQECLLMHPWINQTLESLQTHCAETRQMSVRYGVNTGQWLIQPRIKDPGVPLETGQKSYQEELLGQRFTIASPSFFQVNTAQAEGLVEVVRGYLSPAGQELLVDAYAGVGTFAVLLAPSVGRVIAVEESGTAVRDGRANGQGVPNLEWVEGKVEAVLPSLPERPDAVLVDPPRAGCHPRVLDALAEHRPGKIIYVSCDPATLARDLRHLCDGGFRLVEVQPVDMFPQTYHIESVALLVSQG
ncbi:MAG: 23S rRNA (uracil(1939)-C(5))-methyltransferase RlmD [Chloroflexi bacterium]|nr:23S rRNA (uracil(1939)-C(5))-methyltransferase RlmD [Chloroflexota bacterium]